MIAAVKVTCAGNGLSINKEFFCYIATGVSFFMPSINIPDKLLRARHGPGNCFDNLRIPPEPIIRQLAVIINPRIIDLFGCVVIPSIAKSLMTPLFSVSENLRVKMLVLPLYRS